MNAAAPAIKTVAYRPPAGHRWGVELIPADDLLRRAERAHFEAPQRIGFHLLMAVTGGRLRRTIDFVAHAARRGQWMVAAPAQVQQMDLRSRWHGWIVVARPDFLGPDAPWSSLPPVLHPPPAAHQACLAVLQQMRQDMQAAAVQGMDALLRHQLHVVLARLAVHQAQASNPAPGGGTRPALLQRFRRALDEHHVQCHQVAAYPGLLGCSPRALARACAFAGSAPKAMLDERLALEARRLLAHTTRPVGSIGLELGFSDTSNFNKFFRRAAGCTPQAFRQQWAGPDAAG